jgi:hypothetical protein
MANAAVATHSGKGIIWNKLKGTGTEPLNIQWGDSTVTASAATNVNLFKPQTEARTAGTSTLVTTTSNCLADTYKVVGTITTAVGAKTITEVALFNTTTASPTTTLSASLTASAVLVTIASLTGFPTSGAYYAQIENETVLVTGANSTTLTIARGSLGSTSATHASAVPYTIGGDGMAIGTSATTGQTVAAATLLAAGGDMLLHADFAGIALSVADSINFTITDQLT